MTSKTPKEKCTCQYEKNNGHSFECPLYEAKPYKKENSWEEEFAMKFNCEMTTENQENISAINFITSLLAKQKEEFTKTLNSGRKLYELGKAETKEKIIEMIEEERKQFAEQVSFKTTEAIIKHDVNWAIERIGNELTDKFNSALNIIINKIKNL